MGRSWLLSLSLSATPASLKGHRSSGCGPGESALNSHVCGLAQNCVFSAGHPVVETVLTGVQTTSQHNFMNPEALQNEFIGKPRYYLIGSKPQSPHTHPHNEETTSSLFPHK